MAPLRASNPGRGIAAFARTRLPLTVYVSVLVRRPENSVFWGSAARTAQDYWSEDHFRLNFMQRTRIRIHLSSFW